MEIDHRLHDFEIKKVEFELDGFHIVSEYNGETRKLSLSNVAAANFTPCSQPPIISRLEIYGDSDENRRDFDLSCTASERKESTDEMQMKIVSVEFHTDWKLVCLCETFDVETVNLDESL